MTRLLNITCLAIGIFIGANSGGFLTIKHAPDPKPVKGSIIPPDFIEANSIAIENSFQWRLDSLAQTNNTLGKQSVQDRAALQQAKKDNKVLKAMVDTLIVHAQQQTDTPSMLANCDSVETAVQHLMTTSDRNDSLYEDLAANLQSQLLNKDSAMQVQQQAYNALKLSLDNSLAQQDALTLQSNWYQKQWRKRQINNKLLTTGMAIMTGIALYSFIKH